MKTTQIAITTPQGFLAIPARLISIYDIPCAVHKTPGKTGWSVTALSSGHCFCQKQKTSNGALAYAKSRIDDTGVEQTKKLIAAQPVVPDVNTLKAYEKPVANKVVATDVIRLLAKTTAINEDVIARIIRKSGKHVGRLLGQCPSVWNDPEAAAVWLGICPNPFKVSVGRCLALRGEHRETFLRLSARKFPDWLDADKHALVDLGVW